MIKQSHNTAENGTSISWSEIGRGSPLLLIQGAQDSHRACAKTVPLLADDFWVIIIDLPGNVSACPDAPYPLPGIRKPSWPGYTPWIYREPMSGPFCHLIQSDSGETFGYLATLRRTITINASNRGFKA